MRVYIFAQHYPNPYKPWIDTQVVSMLKAGHDIRMFATGAYRTTVADEVEQYRLESRTSYYPTTLKTLRRHGGRVVRALASRPVTRLPPAVRTFEAGRSLKLNLLAAARSSVLPDEAPDVCYIHDLVTAASLTFLRRIYPGARVCLHFHGGEVGGVARVRDSARIFASVDAVIAGTRFAAQLAVDRGCPPEKIAIAPVGFHLPDYVPSPDRVYAPDGKLRLISVGRMSPEKGILFALEAVRRLVVLGVRRFSYRLVGVGIQFAELEAYVRQHGLEDIVTFAGEKTRREVTAELEHADVLLLPSIVTANGAETQAAVVQEAMLMGCLTLVTATGGVPESNADVMHRFQVPPADAEALERMIREMLGLHPAMMARLGALGRAFVRERYDIDVLMQRMLDHATGRLSAQDPHRFVRANDPRSPRRLNATA